MALPAIPNISDAFRKHINDITAKHKISEKDIANEVFYDILSDSGWNREEVDEMELKHNEVGMDSWTDDQIFDFIAKKVQEWTGYITSWKLTEDGTERQFTFDNNMKKILAQMLPPEQIPDELKIDKDVEETNHHVCEKDIPDNFIDHEVEWISDNIKIMMDGLEPIGDSNIAGLLGI